MNDIVYAGAAKESDREHAHKGLEVAVAEADGKIIFGSNEVKFKRGDAVIVPRQLSHRNPAWQTSVLMENAVAPVREVCVVSGEGAEDMAWVLSRVRRYVAAGEETAIVSDGLARLLNALITAYCAGNGYSPVVKTLMKELDKNLSDPTFSLEYSISSLPLNYDYVRKLFKKEVGLSPLEYLTSARMARAKDIMLSGVTNRFSRYTVSQIAEMCGYAEPLYFSRVFKKFYGVSPTEYAAKLRQ